MVLEGFDNLSPKFVVRRLFSSIEAFAVKAAIVLGAEGAFVCPPDVVLAGSSGFGDEVLGAGVTVLGKAFELLATGERSKDVGNSCPRDTGE